MAAAASVYLISGAELLENICRSSLLTLLNTALSLSLKTGFTGWLSGFHRALAFVIGDRRAHDQAIALG
jgi:hypothetical protein